MSSIEHQLSQELASRAERLASSGDIQQARQLYAQAAELEAKAFEAISGDKVRTKSIIAVSLVALLYKAKLYERAEHFIHSSLSFETLTAPAQTQLRELLEAVWDEKALTEKSKSQYLGQEIILSLRGQAIGFGTAPLDIVSQATQSIYSLLYRIAEWVLGLKFRSGNQPSLDVLNLVQARVTQPATGSYRFTIRLVESSQSDTREKSRITAAKIAETLFEFVRILNVGTHEELESFIPRKGYRKEMLKALGNLAPKGNRLQEVELIREVHGEPESIRIDENVHERISELLAPTMISERSASRLIGRTPEVYELPDDLNEKEMRGILRALDLDRRWIEIALPNGNRRHYETVEGLLERVGGIVFNRRVIIQGSWQYNYGRYNFLVEDIKVET